jgi:hypothetical protein
VAVLLLGAALLAIAAFAAAQICGDYGGGPRIVGGLQWEGTTYRLLPTDSLTYLADIYRGFRIVDTRDPLHPRFVGGVDSLVFVCDLAVRDTLAFVADRRRGLVSITMADPEAPAMIDSLAPPGQARCLALDWPRVILGDRDSLLVADVSDPDSMRFLSSCALPALSEALRLRDGFAFVACREAGLQVVDLRDLSAPLPVASLPLPGLAWDVALANGLAYLACREGGLQIVRITDPAHPALLGAAATAGEAWAVTVMGDLAFVAGGPEGMQVIDVGDPAAPRRVGWLPTAHTMYGVATLGSLLLLGGERDALAVVDVSEYATPLPLGAAAIPGMAGRLLVRNGYAFVTAGEEGLQILDVRDPEAPALAASWPTAEYAINLALCDPYLLLLETGGPQHGAMHVLSISDPRHPALIGSLSTPPILNHVAVAGQIAYLCAGREFLVVDLAQPETPSVLASLLLPQFLSGLALAGDHVLAISFDGYLMAIDVSEPSAPELTGSTYIENFLNSISVRGDRALIASLDNRLLAFNISDPLNPLMTADLAVPGVIWDYGYSGEHAYLAGSEAGLLVLDLSNPDSPELAGGFQTRGITTGACVLYPRLYMTSQEHGLIIMPLQCEEGTPVLLTRFDAVADRGCVRLDWQVMDTGEALAFRLEGMSEGESWLLPWRDLGEGCFAAEDRSARLAVGGAVAYRLSVLEPAEGWRQLRLISLALQPSAMRPLLVGAFPQPARAEAKIRFFLPAMQKSSLEVFDPAGRRVRILAQGDQEAGLHELNWDGRDSAGREVPSGLYLVRLRSMGAESALKLQVMH